MGRARAPAVSIMSKAYHFASVRRRHPDRSTQATFMEDSVMSRRWIAAAAMLLSSALPAPSFAAPSSVEMTWMSIANWYFRIGAKRIMMDAYITRVPGPPFFFAPPDLPGDQYAY